MNEVFISDYDYVLPHERIAEFPLTERDASKLLVYRNGAIRDEGFRQLTDLLPASSLLVLNDSRVIEARIFFQKQSGGQIEIFCLEPFEPSEISLAMQARGKVQMRCLIGGASKWKRGQVLEKKIVIDGTGLVLQAGFEGRETDDFIIGFSWNTDHSFSEIIHAAGNIPLPPYIKRNVIETDAERYQTVFARKEGSVAAPTASLHFTPEIFQLLNEKNIQRSFITLHVGAGTFKPVKTDTIEEHTMHAEVFSVRAATLRSLLNSDFIVAAGTTSLRTLESLYWMGVKLLQQKQNPFELGQWEANELKEKENRYADCLNAILSYMAENNLTDLHCRTSLLICPGYQFHSAKALITNFHQPRSTLLLLVAAFIGDDWKKVYNHALQNGYRFLSYGDSSLLFREG